MIDSEVIVVGAGPAGLATAALLKRGGILPLVVDAHQQVGDSWRAHYDRLKLHTVKQLSALPLRPFPSHYPTYVSRDQFVTYLEDYCKEFRLSPKLNTTVKQIQRSSEGIFELETNEGSLSAKQVVVATGINRTPIIPQWQDQELFQGKVTHSRFFKNAAPYLGQRTLVVGFGNTGAEIALALAEAEVDVTVVVRNPVNIVPRDVFGRPVQLTAKKLEKLPFGLGDRIGTQIRKLVIGDLRAYGIEASKISPQRQLAETGRTPVIDLGTVEKIKAGKIKVVKNLRRFTPSGVMLDDDQMLEIDHVILATGYSASLDTLLPDTEGLLDSRGLPTSPIAPKPWDGLYFIGFDNFKLGGILGTIQADSHFIAKKILKKASI